MTRRRARRNAATRPGILAYAPLVMRHQLRGPLLRVAWRE